MGAVQEDVRQLRGELATSGKDVATGQQRHVAASKQLQASFTLTHTLLSAPAFLTRLVGVLHSCGQPLSMPPFGGKLS